VLPAIDEHGQGVAVGDADDTAFQEIGEEVAARRSRRARA